MGDGPLPSAEPFPSAASSRVASTRNARVTLRGGDAKGEWQHRRQHRSFCTGAAHVPSC